MFTNVKFKIVYIYFSLIFIVFLFTSCQKSLGYSVLLWNIGEHQMCDGDIVKVYIKSNISHVYVAELPSVDGRAAKIEIPLWQLTEPTTRKKAELYSQKLSRYRLKYAVVVLDGLPIRRDPENTSRQVYRLKKDEVIKVLYDGPKATINAGNKPIEAVWLYVLTQDGTQGWCFSYNLRIFDTDRYGTALNKPIEQKKDDGTWRVTSALHKTWYPEYYQTIVDSKVIDTERLNADNYLHLDKSTSTLTFRAKSNLYKSVINEVWHYSGADLVAGNQYRLKGIPITIDLRRDNYIAISYTNETGKPEDFNLVQLNFNISDVIEKELARRDKMYNKLVSSSDFYKSTNYGQLKFNDDKRFLWRGKKAMVATLSVPEIAKRGMRDTGSVSIKYLLSKNLRASFDGVLTFTFDGGLQDVNFLYKLEDTGLRLEDATAATIKDNIVTSRSAAPVVLFFAKSQ